MFCSEKCEQFALLWFWNKPKSVISRAVPLQISIAPCALWVQYSKLTVLGQIRFLGWGHFQSSFDTATFCKDGLNIPENKSFTPFTRDLKGIRTAVLLSATSRLKSHPPEQLVVVTPPPREAQVNRAVWCGSGKAGALAYWYLQDGHSLVSKPTVKPQIADRTFMYPHFPWLCEWSLPLTVQWWHLKTEVAADTWLQLMPSGNEWPLWAKYNLLPRLWVVLP